MKRLLLLLLLAEPLAASSNANDDSCDVAVLSAVTLLLPYFEVDLDRRDVTTLFTITNVTTLDRVAHVTLDRSRLAGARLQHLSRRLRRAEHRSVRVLARGVIAPDRGTGTAVSRRRGTYTDPNPALDLGTCV